MSTEQQAVKDSAGVKAARCWILHARAREYYWEGSGQLSIKAFFGGRAHYEVGCGHHAVDQSSYLVLNDGQTYAIDIESERAVESFCLFFPAGFAPDSTLAFSANITLESSPPDAICSSGRMVSPAFVAMR